MKTKEFLSFPFEIKQMGIDDNYFYFEGYASTFDNVDLGDDKVLKGAFEKSLSKKIPKLMWQHKLDEPVGVLQEVYEDEKGLWVKGKLPKDDTLVNGRIMPQIKAGSVDSMSIGYMTIDDSIKGGIRELKEIDVHEISFVSLAMNPKARITGFKAVVPYKDWDILKNEEGEPDTSYKWDSAAAVKRWREKSGSLESPSNKYRNGFLWYDAENANLFTAYKLPIVDVVDGTTYAIPRAINAANAAMAGARGGVDISDADRAGVQRNIDKYRAKLGLNEKDMDIDIESLDKEEKSVEIEIKNATKISEVSKFLRSKGLTSKESDIIVSKIKEFSGLVEKPEISDCDSHKKSQISQDDIRQILSGLIIN